MNAAAATRQTPTGWFATWFDTVHYQKLYAHRDQKEAAGFIDQVTARLRPGPDAVMLDLGCGTGRHATYLASKGFDVTGLDLSAESIAMARQNAGRNLRFVRGDMREP